MCLFIISRTARGKREEMLHKVMEERNILHAIKRRNAKWVQNILRRNCLYSALLRERGRTDKAKRRRKQLLDDGTIRKVDGN